MRSLSAPGVDNNLAQHNETHNETHNDNERTNVTRRSFVLCSDALRALVSGDNPDRYDDHCARTHTHTDRMYDLHVIDHSKRVCTRMTLSHIRTVYIVTPDGILQSQRFWVGGWVVKGAEKEEVCMIGGTAVKLRKYSQRKCHAYARAHH